MAFIDSKRSGNLGFWVNRKVTPWFWLIWCCFEDIGRGLSQKRVHNISLYVIMVLYWWCWLYVIMVLNPWIFFPQVRPFLAHISSQTPHNLRIIFLHNNSSFEINSKSTITITEENEKHDLWITSHEFSVQHVFNDTAPVHRTFFKNDRRQLFFESKHSSYGYLGMTYSMIWWLIRCKTPEIDL